MQLMKRFFLENWQAKLMCLIVATAVWYLIKKNVDSVPAEIQSARRSILGAPGR
jgi:YbbR domain-containing protein